MALAKEYTKKGHNVEIFSFDNLPGYIPEKLKAVVFPYYLALYIDKRIRKGRLDVIDASTGDAWVWGALHRKGHRGRTVLVTHSHGLEHMAHHVLLQERRAGTLNLSWKYPIYHGGLRLREVATSLKVADLIFFLNQEEMEFGVKSLRVVRSRASVVPNGIEDRIMRLPVSFEPLDTGSVGIAQVGSYIQRKGIHYSKNALNILLLKYRNVEVGFFGTGCPPGDVLSSFDVQFHSRIHVVPHYSKSQLPDLLRSYQIKLFPTLSEGFSLALVESMACGLAPVASSVAAAKDIIQPGINGLLVPPADSGAIVSALERLLKDRPLLNKLRRNAYDSAQQYSWEHVASMRLLKYKELLSTKKSGGSQ